MSNNSKKIQKIAINALFCAFVLALTFVSVPTPGFGNVNLGDCALLLCILLSPTPLTAVAVGAGAALSDLLSAYAIYAPATLVIKVGMAFAAMLILHLFKKTKLPRVLSRISASLLAEIVMVLGYFVYECWILSFGIAAAANIPFNCVQGGVAILLSSIAFPLIEKTKLVKFFQ